MWLIPSGICETCRPRCFAKPAEHAETSVRLKAEIAQRLAELAVAGQTPEHRENPLPFGKKTSLLPVGQSRYQQRQSPVRDGSR